MSRFWITWQALQPRRLLEAYGAGMNSENEREADPGTYTAT